MRKTIYSKISYLGLSFAFALVLFFGIASLIGSGVVILTDLFNLQEDINNLSDTLVLTAIGVITFLLVSTCLLVSEISIERNLFKIEKKINQKVLPFLSILLLLIIIVVVYFGFSYLIIYLNNNYWL